jgi:hypothetical protein
MKVKKVVALEYKSIASWVAVMVVGASGRPTPPGTPNTNLLDEPLTTVATLGFEEVYVKGLGLFEVGSEKISSDVTPSYVKSVTPDTGVPIIKGPRVVAFETVNVLVSAVSP